jgi:hypothetical protein
MTDDKMFKILAVAIADLPRMMEERDRWTSLIVNRRKPWTYRAARAFDYEGETYRICLHRFEVCDEAESFLHPHPWPGAFRILYGSYIMNLGMSWDRVSGPADVAKFTLTAGARYAITNPLTWHSVTPLEECWTVMVNGKPWDPEKVAHTQIRTTKGKDLDSMSHADLSHHFDMFQRLLRG